MNVVDRIRLDDFRKLKKEIRVSMKHLIVGIDKLQVFVYL